MRPAPPTVFDRQPPQDLAAEQSVLGGMLMSKDASGLDKAGSLSGGIGRFLAVETGSGDTPQVNLNGGW